MKLSLFSIFILVCTLSSLCLTAGCAARMEHSEKSANSENEKYNLFRPNPKSGDANKTKPRSDSERLRLITQGLQEGINPEKKDNRRVLLIFGSILGGTGAVVAGLLYWKLWRRKMSEWEINDPMALMKELNHVHQISETEKLLMQEISGSNALSSPLPLFVEPKYFLAAMESNSYISARSTIRRLLSKLFSTSLEENTGTTDAESETVLYTGTESYRQINNA